jgi:hypothetical protein
MASHELQNSTVATAACSVSVSRSLSAVVSVFTMSTSLQYIQTAGGTGATRHTSSVVNSIGQLPIRVEQLPNDWLQRRAHRPQFGEETVFRNGPQPANATRATGARTPTHRAFYDEQMLGAELAELHRDID